MFTGTLPPIESPSIILVDFSGNYIGGKLPDYPIYFDHLKTIDLSSNKLTGKFH